MRNNNTFMDPSIFLNRLKWKSCTGDFDNITDFSIDCYRFRFDPALEMHVQTEFIDYVNSVSLRDDTSIVDIAIWLFQHKIPFRLRFHWCRHQSIPHNLRRLFRPRYIQSFLGQRMDQVMSYDLTAKKNPQADA